MNCKQGDIAIVVVGDNRGAMLRCVELTSISASVAELMELKGPVWAVECMSRAVNALDQVIPAGRRAMIEDRRLRPIRDPGDDARDETLDWLPVPERERLTSEDLEAIQMLALDEYMRRTG